MKTRRIDCEWDRQFIVILAEKYHVEKETLFNAFVKRNDALSETQDVTEEISEDDYRLAEYKVLVKSSGSDAQDFHSQNYPTTHYNPVISKYFKSISLVPKLRETRAFVDFKMHHRAKPWCIVSSIGRFAKNDRSINTMFLSIFLLCKESASL